jgi:hypothetical protein
MKESSSHSPHDFDFALLDFAVLDFAVEDRMPRKTAKKKYGPKAQQKVKRAMRERKHGTLKSGRSGKKVTSRKQAIAIGLSEARKAGAKVPAKKS